MLVRSLLPVLLAGLCAPVQALEHGSAFPYVPEPAPAGTATCELWYFDSCYPLVFDWPADEPGETYGVQYESCAGNAALDGVWVWSLFGSPAGWGYTATMSVYATDGPGSPVEPPLVEQPFLPGQDWTWAPFGVPVPGSFLVTIRYEGTEDGRYGDPPYSDFGGAAPCIPIREPHSYYFGTAASPVRPGSPLTSPLHGAYEFFWQAWLSAPTDVPAESWSSIKALYR